MSGDSADRTAGYDGVDESVLERHADVAADALESDAYGHLIDGEWVESAGGGTMAATDATTGQVLATVQSGTAEDVDRAVDAAREAAEGNWGSTSPTRRADLLEEVADALQERKSEIARLDSLEVGKPNKHALFVDAEILVDQFRTFAALARTEDHGRMPASDDDKHVYTRKEPYGVVGAISAWNFPAMFVAWKLAPALAAGNAVVFKPSSRASLSTLEVARTIDTVLPSGAVNVVTGPGSEVGDAITSHPEVRKVSLTGSTTAGKYAMQNAAERIAPVSLELGGKSPNVVCPDADVEEAVEGTLVSIFFNQGQQCTAGSRLFLHEEIRDEFMATFREKADDLSVGDPLSPMTDIGPMVDPDHRDDVVEYVETATAEGASVAYEGDDPDADVAGAPFVSPTVLEDVADEDTVACEEVFGPVLTVFEWSDREEVIRRANDTEYGLAAGIWTSDLETAHEMAADLEAGTVWVNTYNDLFDPAPHGGYKQSGTGRELSVEALEEYQQVKTVKVSLGDIPSL